MRKFAKWTGRLLLTLILSVVVGCIVYHRPFPHSPALDKIELRPTQRTVVDKHLSFGVLRYSWQEYNKLRVHWKPRGEQWQWFRDPAFLLEKLKKWDAISRYFERFLQQKTCLSFRKGKREGNVLDIEVLDNLRSSIELLSWKSVLEAQMGSPNQAARRLLKMAHYIHFIESSCVVDLSYLFLRERIVAHLQTATSYLLMHPALSDPLAKKLISFLRSLIRQKQQPLVRAIQQLSEDLLHQIKQGSPGRNMYVSFSLDQWPWLDIHHLKKLTRQYLKLVLYYAKRHPRDPAFWKELPEETYFIREWHVWHPTHYLAIFLNYNSVGKRILLEQLFHFRHILMHWHRRNCLSAVILTQLRNAWKDQLNRRQWLQTRPRHPWTGKPMTQTDYGVCMPPPHAHYKYRNSRLLKHKLFKLPPMYTGTPSQLKLPKVD